MQPTAKRSFIFYVISGSDAWDPKHYAAGSVNESEYVHSLGRRMNPSTFIGIVASVLLLRVVLFFSTETPPIFIDLPGLGIVLIRTLVATFISCSLKEVMRNEWVYAQQNIDELVPISRIWMTGDVQKVERVLSRYAHRPKSHRSRHENRAVLCVVTGGTFSRDVEKSLKAGY